MVDVTFSDNFKKDFNKIKNKNLRKKIIKQIQKIKENPITGKPLRYSRKGTRELYVKPFRLSYAWSEPENKVFVLGLYHKDSQ